MLARSASLCLVCCALAGLIRLAHAVTVVVPDDYATIQGAIDSTTADVIQVRDGDYPERLVVDRYLTLQEYPVTGQTHQAFPSIQGLHIEQGDVTCHGFRFRGGVTLRYPDHVWFESCRFDSGLVTLPYAATYPTLRGCLIFGGAAIVGIGVAIYDCSFIGGGLTVVAEGVFDIRGNYFAGPAAAGLQATSADANGWISDNLVVGTTDGIVLTPAGTNPIISRNEVRDCSGSAYRVVLRPSGYSGSVALLDNRARHCGGSGIEFAASVTYLQLRRNQIDSVGSHGILVARNASSALAYVDSNVVLHAGGCGVAYTNATTSEGDILLVRGNAVIGAALDGLRLKAPWVVERNVVGRCGGTGVVVDTVRTSGGMAVRSNTVYLNDGAGFRLTGSAADSVEHNLAYGSGGYGLQWTGSGAPLLGCNDWYGNLQGSTSGVAPAATDLQLNPLFCDLPQDSVTLSAVSALVDVPGCGLIGALGVGCSYPSAVSPPTFPYAAGLRVMPQPAGGRVQFSWRRLGQPATVEIYDATGARRWRAQVGPEQEELRWDGTDKSGRMLPAGVYFALLTGPSFHERARVVLVR